MLTFKQLFKKSRVKKTSVLKAPFLQKNPQKKAGGGDLSQTVSY